LLRVHGEMRRGLGEREKRRKQGGKKGRKKKGNSERNNGGLGEGKIESPTRGPGNDGEKKTYVANSKKRGGEGGSQRPARQGSYAPRIQRV